MSKQSAVQSSYSSTYLLYLLSSTYHHPPCTSTASERENQLFKPFQGFSSRFPDPRRNFLKLRRQRRRRYHSNTTTTTYHHYRLNNPPPSIDLVNPASAVCVIDLRCPEEQLVRYVGKILPALDAHSQRCSKWRDHRLQGTRDEGGDMSAYKRRQVNR